MLGERFLLPSCFDLVAGLRLRILSVCTTFLLVTGVVVVGTLLHDFVTPAERMEEIRLVRSPLSEPSPQLSLSEAEFPEIVADDSLELLERQSPFVVDSVDLRDEPDALNGAALYNHTLASNMLLQFASRTLPAEDNESNNLSLSKAAPAVTTSQGFGPVEAELGVAIDSSERAFSMGFGPDRTQQDMVNKTRKFWLDKSYFHPILEEVFMRKSYMSDQMTVSFSGRRLRDQSVASVADDSDLRVLQHANEHVAKFKSWRRKK